MPAPRVKIALVGCSGYGDSYLDSLLNDPRRARVEFAAVADPAPHRCRRTDALRAAGVAHYPTLEALLDAVRDLRLVMMATPTHLHAPHAIAAHAYGADVLCEKPLAGSVADALRLARHAEIRPDPFIAIGYQWSFSPAIQRLKQDILAGVLGRPRRLKCVVSFPRARTYYARNDWAGRLTTPRGELVMDSPVNNATAHYLHNMLYLLGGTRETSAVPEAVTAELYRANPIETFDTAALRIDTRGGAEVLFYTTHASDLRGGPVSVFEFEHATVTHDALAAVPLRAVFRDGAVRDYGDPNADRHEKIWQCVESVVTREPPACGVMAALPHTLVTAALSDSCPRVGDFPDALVDTQFIGEDPMVCVRDLGATLRDCFDRDLLPSEAGVAWARPGARVPVPFADVLVPGRLVRPVTTISTSLPAALPAGVAAPA